MAPTSTTVQHITKNLVVITPAKGYSVITITLADGNVEALVAADDGSETIRLLVAGPTSDQEMIIRNWPDGCVHFTYVEKPDV